MDKNLLNRLDKLEQGTDIGDVRTASTEALMAYLAEVMGFVPTTKQLEQYVAERVEGSLVLAEHTGHVGWGFASGLVRREDGAMVQPDPRGGTFGGTSGSVCR